MKSADTRGRALPLSGTLAACLLLVLLTGPVSEANPTGAMLHVEQRAVVDSDGQLYQMEHRAGGDGKRWIVHNGTRIALRLTRSLDGDVKALHLDAGESVAVPCSRGVIYISLVWPGGRDESLLLMCGDVVAVDEDATEARRIGK